MTPSLAASPKLTSVLVALCLGLGWLVYGALEPSATQSRMATVGGVNSSQPEPVSKFVVPDFQVPSIDEFDAIVARPLFNKTRRPVIVAEPDASEAPVAGAIMLSGIVIENDRRIAHLRSDADPRIRALGVGDAVGNWRVELILADRVVLRSSNGIKTIFMQKFDAAKNVKPPSVSRKMNKKNQRALQRIYRKLGTEIRGNK